MYKIGCLEGMTWRGFGGLVWGGIEISKTYSVFESDVSNLEDHFPTLSFHERDFILF